MSEQTADAVKRAETQLDALESAATQQKQKTLELVAARLPGKADAIAKQYAHDQPDVTRTLGKAGVATLRADVAAEAAKLGQAFIDARDEIVWPDSGPLGTSSIHSAIFKRFHGKVGGIITPIMEAGYDPTSGGSRSRDLLPQYLYEHEWFVGLAEVLSDLALAKIELKNARDRDNKAAVDDLWA